MLSLNQIDAYEDALREAEKNIESALYIILLNDCQNPNAPKEELSEAIDIIQEAIHSSWMLEGK